MGLIERLKRKAQARESEQQANKIKLVETEVLHKQRKDQAASFRKESGIGDLVPTAAALLKKVRFPDASYREGGAIQTQRLTEPDSVFDSIIWGHRETPVYMRSPRKTNSYVSIATRPSGEIVFYAKEEILIPATDWRNDKDILERTLEQTLNSPGVAMEPDKEIPYGAFPSPPLRGPWS